MYKVLIVTNNSMFSHGLTSLLWQTFMADIRAIICAPDNDCKEEVAMADIIVMDFSKGESAICHHALQSRSEHSVVIGFYDGNCDVMADKIPSCLNNTLFIKRKESVDNIVELMRRALSVNRVATPKPCDNICLGCNRSTLTPQQITFINHYYNGYETHAIARRMNVGVKTVSTHKRLVMKKLCVTTDCDLLNLLKSIKSKSFQTGYFIQ